MKTKKPFFFCFLSIILSVVALLATFVRIIPTLTVTGETYIGLLVALMGICVTFAIGFQIYSTLDIKESVNAIKRLDDELNGAKSELEEAKSKLEEAMKTATDLEDFKHETTVEIESSKGILQFDAGRYLLAICHYMIALYHSLECNRDDKVGTCIHNTKQALKYWDGDKSDNPFYCNYHIGEDHPKYVIFNRINEIGVEFADNESYRKIKNDLLNIRKRVLEKVEAYDTK